MISAGGAAAATVALVKADSDEPKTPTLYLHGMVWNRQLPAPMNDWLVRLDAKADLPVGDPPAEPPPAFGTLGDDFHDAVSSRFQFQKLTRQADRLTVTGVITESKTASLVGQMVRIDGMLAGAAVQGLTVTIGESVFNGAGLAFIFKPVAVKTISWSHDD